MSTTEIEKLKEKEINPTLEKVKALQITDNDQNIEAGEYDKKLKALEKQITDELEPGYKKAYSLYKDLKATCDKYVNPIKEARKLLKTKIGAFIVQKQREADAEQRKIDAQRRKEEREEKDRIQKEIDEAKESGDVDKAKELRQEKKAVYIAPQANAEQPESAKGVGLQKMRHYAEITNPALVPREFCEPHLPKLNAEARRTEGKAKIPGVVIRSEPIISTRG